ncbi:MAG: O-antigen ligase family protein [Verrucomicrobiota bacterium]
MPNNNIRAIFLGVIASLPAWLGGDLATWKLGIFALVLAVYGCCFPPGFDLPRPLNWAAGLVVCWPLTGLVPRFFSASWHQQLTSLGIDTGWCWTPQPWVLLDAWLAVLIGGFWFLCLFGSRLSVHETHLALRVCGMSLVGVAVIALASSLTQFNVPGWDPMHGIGPFPNRNQAGNLYAFSGLMLLALAAHESRNKRSPYWIWAVGSGVLFLAAVVNGSRTGVILFLVGAMVWSLLHLVHVRNKRNGIILMSVSGLCLAAFLFIGGEALQRLSATVSGIHGGEGILAGRWDIWQDSARLFATAPLHGVGIGNFSELFALFRERLIAENRVIHPDSDYVWWLTEIGIIGMALIVWTIVLVLKPYFRGNGRSGRRLRSAAMVASGLFLVHALVDVSAHRLGTLLPALLWLRLSWPASKSDDFQLPLAGKHALAAVILMFGIGIWLVIPQITRISLPNRTYVEKVKTDWQQEFETSPAGMMKRMRFAEVVAPLDWEVHYYLGFGALLYERRPDEAWKHWTIARQLEPMLSELPYQEGQLWLRSDVARAWFVWREALQRRNENRSGLLRDMLREAQALPELEETLLFMASSMPELQHFVLGRLTEKQFLQQRVAYLEKISPEDTGSSEIMRRVFNEWTRREGLMTVATFLRDHPEWMAIGWKHVIEDHKTKQEFREAYEVMVQLFPQPAYPEINDSPASRGEHLRRLVQGSGDLVSVYSFFKYDRDQLSLDKGKKLIQQVTRESGLPHYMRYMIADYLASFGEWKDATVHLEAYGRKLEN